MIDLIHLNTLKVPAQAKALVELHNLADLKNINFSEPYMFLGSGANVLFTKDFPGTIILNKYLGKKIVSETEDSVIIEVNSGELWHDIVTWSVDHNWSGMENMALIPGTVGAAVVGNIAAYGQDQEDIFESLTAIDLKTKKSHTFKKSDMNFAYRESVLKNNPHHYFIASVVYRLSKSPQFSTGYTAKRHQSLLPTLQLLFPDIKNYTSRHIFDAVVKLRTEKLPDWRTTPNAGSFFKNPLITKEKYFTLKAIVPDLHAYPPDKLTQIAESEWIDTVSQVKIPAGRLIDQLGWRGKRIGNVGTHSAHALVIVNYGATGAEIYAFTENIRKDIKSHYDIDLEYEVKII